MSVYEGTIVLTVRWHSSEGHQADEELKYIAGDIAAEYNRNVEMDEDEEDMPEQGFTLIVSAEAQGQARRA